MTPRWGLLLVNLGTPAAPTFGAVARYLREFLSDPRVLSLPALPRWLLLHAVILPFRSGKSAAAYRSVWTPEGSPLLVHGRALATAVQDKLGPGVRVELAMRYQEPSLREGLRRLRQAGVDRVVVFPLYPHYAASSWGSTAEAVMRLAAREWDVPSLSFVPPCYEDPRFIEACAQVARPLLEQLRPDKVVMSFHGLPEEHVRRSDASRETGQPAPHCLARPDCCHTITPANRNCYRAQCHATARLLAAALGLEHDRWELAFQSRLTRRWIQPFFDHRIEALPGEGVKKVLVLEPSFVADCLETLEEVGIRARESFQAAGGAELTLCPSLNAHPSWVQAVADMAREAAWVPVLD